MYLKIVQQLIIQLLEIAILTKKSKNCNKKEKNVPRNVKLGTFFLHKKRASNPPKS